MAVRRRAAESGSAGLYQWLYWVALALLTAFYTFRAFFSTFYGEEQIPHEAGGHAHESPRSMLVPLVGSGGLRGAGRRLF